MYIRSQNKKMLIPINDLTIALDCRDFTKILAYHPSCSEENNYYTLGIYKSQERCIEVLNSIENEIMYSNHYSHSGINSSECQNCL